MGNPSSAYDVMIDQLLPQAVERFRRAAGDYGDVFQDLGLRGQYSDMHRKMAKLRRAIWEEQPLAREQIDEILSDLIGNCLIGLYLVQEEKAKLEFVGRTVDVVERAREIHRRSES